MAPVKINEFISLNSFKKEIRNWVPQNCLWRFRRQYIGGVGFIFRVLAIYIYTYIYIHIYLLTEFMKNFQIKLVYTNKKTLLFDKLPTTNYFFLLFICTWYLCYIFSMMALVLISHKVYLLRTVFKPN